MRKNARTRIAALALTAVIGALVAGPGTAMAQDALSNPSAAQYQPKSQVEGTTTTGAGAVADNSSSSGGSGGSSTGTLPFTGMDVLVLSAVALALIGTGIALRRLSSPKAPRV
jgi:hypothetical protein